MSYKITQTIAAEYFKDRLRKISQPSAQPWNHIFVVFWNRTFVGSVNLFRQHLNIFQRHYRPRYVNCREVGTHGAKHAQRRKNSAFHSSTTKQSG